MFFTIALIILCLAQEVLVVIKVFSLFFGINLKCRIHAKFLAKQVVVVI